MADKLSDEALKEIAKAIMKTNPVLFREVSLVYQPVTLGPELMKELDVEPVRRYIKEKLKR